MASSANMDEQSDRLPEEMLKGLTHDSILISKKDLVIGEEIGKGAFSRVYKGTYKGIPVAVKKQTISEENPEKFLMTELGVLHGVKHPNLIRYYGASFEGKEIFIITELMVGGELKQLLDKEDFKLPWKLRVRIARDIAAAICYLHEQQLLHRDIKPDNVLIDDDWRPVLSDYGFARKRQTAAAMTICGTEEFMAPEMIWGEDYDERVDVFSFGMLLVEMITGRRPGKHGWLERTPRNKFNFEMADLEAAIPPECPDSLTECLKQCLAYEPDDRLDSDSMLEWLQELYAEMEGDEAAPKPTDILGGAAIGSASHADAQAKAAQDAVAAAVAGQGTAGGSSAFASKLAPRRPAFKPSLGGVGEAAVIEE